MPSRRLRNSKRQAGFALVVTLSLMLLLTVIAVGLMSLSAISLRSTSAQAPKDIARANARLALMMALGELQKSVGDDRRVTADASIFDSAQNPNVVGVWKSWSPKLVDNTLPASPPNYTTAKDARFVGWLTSSSTPGDMAGKDWAKTGSLANPIELFTKKSDGFSLSGSKVNIQQTKPYGGAMAWTVVQDATRAKINVSGPEDNQRVINDDLQAQPRPSLVQSDNFKQPVADWNQRAERVLSMSQAKLDSDLWKGGAGTPEGAHFTSQGLGLLTDAVNGGLKTDMSLGFEMPDADYTSLTWTSGSTTYKNPFRSSSVTLYSVPTSFQKQRPLFRPRQAAGSVKVTLKGYFNGVDTTFGFPAASVPTFETLRSYYRTPYYLYNSADGATVFERGIDNVSAKPAANENPGAPPPGTATKTGYRPVLDRVLYVLSPGVGADKEVRLVITPLVTLWNPYNVALEVEGAVVYPWLDFPFSIKWNFSGGTPFADNNKTYPLSTIIGPGRSLAPYFYAAIKPSSGQSIRFKPGEVRLFAPTLQTDVPLTALSLGTGQPIASRMLALTPVDSPNQLSVKGGFALPMRNAATNSGFSHPMAPTESAQIEITPNQFSDYPYSVGLEDATRIKAGAAATDTTHGQSLGDVQTVSFSKSGDTGSASTTAVTAMRSPVLSYAELSDVKFRKPFGMLETYHRVAAGTSASRQSDLVYTVNPRQPFINNYVTNGNFITSPHYETRMQELSTLDNLIQTENNGRSAFYGASNSAGSGGRSQLSFFEAPQAQPLSLAAFQHADLSGTCYSPAYQIGNSWANPYLARNAVAGVLPGLAGAGKGLAKYDRDEMPVYDYSYLANEVLWDAFYFSGASPKVTPGTTTGSASIWNGSGVANVSGTYKTALTDFIDDPAGHPLRNPRMKFHAGNSTLADLKADLLKPEGCMKLAAHLCVDGAFNINSTSEKAWTAFLSGMRDRDFSVLDKDGHAAVAPTGGKTAFPRFRNPIGTSNDYWMGFRSLTDSEVAQLAKQIVVQVKGRGPFLSLGEFVNRRVENSALGLKGAIQSAIDDAGFNTGAYYANMETKDYPAGSKDNISPPNTGVAIPGYLTQADVLQSISPVMTVRSDTFTIRGYGEAKDVSGKMLASVCCEAVVQRMPEFVDGANPSHATIAELNSMNQFFGRKFSIVSFRYLNDQELVH